MERKETPGNKPLERFKDLARRILAVPKAEIEKAKKRKPHPVRRKAPV